MRYLLSLLAIPFLIAFTGCNRSGRLAEQQGTDTIPVVDSLLKPAVDSLTAAFHDLMADPCMRDATLGYLVVDCSYPKPVVLAEHNAPLLMIPASTLKLFVTCPALEIFGEPVVPEVMTINQFSVNWRSSKLLRRIGGQVYGQASNGSGIRAITEFWKKKGLDMDGIFFDDGNGLSRNNRISPRQLVDVLTIMQHSPWFHVFYSSLPVAGYTGTMRKMLAGNPESGRIRAKTGSIAGVKSLAGYVSTGSGKRLAFAIIINDFYCKKKVMRSHIEEILLRMTRI